jgi:thioredoxin-related protein
MKKVVLFLIPIFIISTAFVKSTSTVEVKDINQTKIEWLTLQEAVARNQKNPKMIFIDFYTDWNEWCQKMDADVFPNPQIVDALSKNFYAVKFDAEKDQVITFQGKEYKLDVSGRRPEHQLAIEMATTNDRLGFPTYVVLDKNLTKLKAFQGFKTVDRLKQILDYYGIESNYKNKTWIEFIQEAGF